MRGQWRQTDYSYSRAENTVLHLMLLVYEALLIDQHCAY
jgi:hypothetical protein